MVFRILCVGLSVPPVLIALVYWILGGQSSKIPLWIPIMALLILVVVSLSSIRETKATK